MDFLASNDDLDTSQLNWTLEAVKVDYDANRLARAATGRRAGLP